MRQSARGGRDISHLSYVSPVIRLTHVHLVSSMACGIHGLCRLGFLPRIPHEIPDLDATGQAGGVCRHSDGGMIVNGLFRCIELKGSCRQGDTRTTFTFKNIRPQKHPAPEHEPEAPAACRQGACLCLCLCR